MENEIRIVRDGELRAAGDLKVSGYAAVFGEKSLPLSEHRHTFTESIRKGAFARTIVEDDVRALYNHNPAAILARNRAGTMDLSEDHVGLRTVIRLPNTQLGRDVYENVRLRNLSGMSFGFQARKDVWTLGGEERELLDVILSDVSICAYPAYPSTSVEARSVGFPSDSGEVLVYAGVPTVSDAERDRLRLKLSLLRRL
jgi:HK97 family phage prohead protease